MSKFGTFVCDKDGNIVQIAEHEPYVAKPVEEELKHDADCRCRGCKRSRRPVGRDGRTQAKLYTGMYL